MTDIVTYCDVNTCEDCPRYGDDCDGDKRVEHTDYISRADAIEAVRGLSELVDDKDFPYFEDALKALPSADATVGDYPNDLISRSALMEYCSNQKSKSIDNNDIARFPSADAVHGEWLQREIINDDMECGVNDDATECSVCGYAFNSHYWAKTYFNYCPNCGARMKGGAE